MSSEKVLAHKIISISKKGERALTIKPNKSFSFGTDATCQIRLKDVKDAGFAAVHCQVTPIAGKMFVVPHGSVSVNGHLIKGAVPLTSGDTISLGTKVHVNFRYEAVSSDTPVESTTPFKDITHRVASETPIKVEKSTDGQLAHSSSSLFEAVNGSQDRSRHDEDSVEDKENNPTGVGKERRATETAETTETARPEREEAPKSDVVATSTPGKPLSRKLTYSDAMVPPPQAKSTKNTKKAPVESSSSSLAVDNELKNYEEEEIQQISLSSARDEVEEASVEEKKVVKTPKKQAKKTPKKNTKAKKAEEKPVEVEEKEESEAESKVEEESAKPVKQAKTPKKNAKSTKAEEKPVEVEEKEESEVESQAEEPVESPKKGKKGAKKTPKKQTKKAEEKPVEESEASEVESKAEEDEEPKQKTAKKGAKTPKKNTKAKKEAEKVEESEEVSETEAKPEKKAVKTPKKNAKSKKAAKEESEPEKDESVEEEPVKEPKKTPKKGKAKQTKAAEKSQSEGEKESEKEESEAEDKSQQEEKTEFKTPTKKSSKTPSKAYIANATYESPKSPTKASPRPLTISPDKRHLKVTQITGAARHELYARWATKGFNPNDHDQPRQLRNSPERQNTSFLMHKVYPGTATKSTAKKSKSKMSKKQASAPSSPTKTVKTPMKSVKKNTNKNNIKVKVESKYTGRSAEHFDAPDERSRMEILNMTLVNMIKEQLALMNDWVVFDEIYTYHRVHYAVLNCDALRDLVKALVNEKVVTMSTKAGKKRYCLAGCEPAEPVKETKIKVKEELPENETDDEESEDEGDLRSELQQEMMQIWLRVKSAKSPKYPDAVSPFMHRPNKAKYPEYYASVNRVVTMKMILQAIKAGEYETMEDMAKDFRQMFVNFKRFNRQKSPVYRCGALLEKEFKAAMKAVKDAVNYKHDESEQSEREESSDRESDNEDEADKSERDEESENGSDNEEQQSENGSDNEEESAQESVKESVESDDE